MEFEHFSSYATFAATAALFAGLGHLAFRSPRFRRYELMRRAIGEAVVLALFYSYLVVPGHASKETWLLITGGFVIAGCVKALCEWFDRSRKRGLEGRFNERHGDETAD